MPAKRIIFFTYNAVSTAHEQLRVISPLKYAGIEIIQGIQGNSINVDRIRDAQLVVFQRDFSRKFSEFQTVIQHAHMAGIPVVLDLDDHLLALPPDHPDRRSHVFAGSLVALLCAILEVDAITVASPVLEEVLKPYNPNVYVLPNYLDADIWKFRNPEMAEESDSVRILFMGTPTHKPDLDLISDVLTTIVEKYRERVSFVFCGINPPEKLARFEKTQYIPMGINDYRLFANKMQDVEADIAIAPLVDNLFNRCKSSIKYLEYSAIGLPGVYSKVDPYSAIINNGEEGFLVENHDEWIEKISILIEDPARRKEMARRAQKQVLNDWMIEDHASAWKVAYDQITSKTKQVHSAVTKSYGMVLNSIAMQLEEDEIRFQSLEDLRRIVSMQNHEMDDLQKVNQNLSKELDQTRLEVLDYALSTSWKLTRPLRKLSRLFRRR